MSHELVKEFSIVVALFVTTMLIICGHLILDYCEKMSNKNKK